MISAPPEIDILSYGAYTIPQAARLARVQTRTANSWFDSDQSRGPAVRLHMPENSEGLISFVDLVQLLGVREIRHHYHLALGKIRAALKTADELGIAYPFAQNSSRAFLLGDTIVFKMDDGNLVEATGRHAKAYLLEPVVLPYLTDLTFGPKGLACEYRPLDNILLTPKREWGAPVVESCGYTVGTLVDAVKGEGSIQRAAEMCGVTQGEVRSALRYEDLLLGIAA
jgi:uncharacterized protein (DUF433 family)